MTRGSRGRRMAWCVGLCTAGIAAAALWSCREDIAGWWRWQTVKKLLDPAQRERVYRDVVSRQRYRGKPAYKVELPGMGERIARVIECPQRGWGPMLAVVFSDGTFELVDFDGTLVPVYTGWNVTRFEFRDLNADGILDRTDSILRSFDGKPMDEKTRFIETFMVIPMTPAQEPRLVIGFRRSSPAGEWDWQLRDSQDARCPEIVIGPKDAATGAIKPQAVYQWNEAQREYAGPEGGVDQDFIRAHQPPEERLEVFAQRMGVPDEEK